MCVQCGGWTAGDFLDRQRALIEEHGWSIVAVGSGGRYEPPFAYTVGLTRYHGHPELLVSGLVEDEAGPLLNGLGRRVSEGHRFAAGDLVTATGRSLQLLQVREPQQLLIAQEVYGGGGLLVPALQVAWGDDAGLWPWDRAWMARGTEQELFGGPGSAAPPA